MTYFCKNISVIEIKPDETGSLPEGLLRINYSSAAGCQQDWAFVLPVANSDTWVVNLHGHGSHGDQLFTRMDIKRDWLTTFQKLGFGILAPNLRDNAWMSPAAVCDLRSLINMVRERFKVKRFIFVSGSMGGTGNLIYATQYPDDVAGIVSMCPASDVGALYEHLKNRPDLKSLAEAIAESYGGTPGQIPEIYEKQCVQKHINSLTMPVYIAHGENDESIPVSQSQQLVTVFSGDNLKYIEIPGGHHDSPLAKIYLEQGLRWILKS